MDGLFDVSDEIEPEFRGAVKALSEAREMNVPWPFDLSQDLSLLRRIKTKYPAIDANAMVEDFLVWCLDATPWKDGKGKPVTIRWRARLWTWANNDERYRTAEGAGRGRRGSHRSYRTHHAATPGGHADTTEVLDEW